MGTQTDGTGGISGRFSQAQLRAASKTLPGSESDQALKTQQLLIWRLLIKAVKI